MGQTLGGERVTHCWEEEEEEEEMGQTLGGELGHTLLGGGGGGGRDGLDIAGRRIGSHIVGRRRRKRWSDIAGRRIGSHIVGRRRRRRVRHCWEENWVTHCWEEEEEEKDIAGRRIWSHIFGRRRRRKKRWVRHLHCWEEILNVAIHQCCVDIATFMEFG